MKCYHETFEVMVVDSSGYKVRQRHNMLKGLNAQDIQNQVFTIDVKFFMHIHRWSTKNDKIIKNGFLKIN
ncbi:hypothetical protein OUZ56_022868 [Daphnia magna]|uniref:Uncharacterized protein n=1 Tax=Daphnia magna TaxID=35525 RepID=A0ABR0AXP8_9CRUS|nr:hypothetical protein OUZ56_022868 [Daphnia magna]